MTFKDLLDQLQQLTPEQLQQEIKFVKCGAGSDYDWSGLAEDTYSENADRVQLSVDPEGVWYYDDEYSSGIVSGLTKDELKEFGDDKTEIVPPNMPYFSIEEGE